MYIRTHVRTYICAHVHVVLHIKLHTQVGLNTFAYMLILPVVEHVAEWLTSVRRLATCSLL